MHLQGRAEEVRVRVEDNGRGNGSTTHLGHGLSTVRRRAGRLDGGATFSNGPQGGFVLEAWLRPDAGGAAADRVRN
jgi:signal transduction histidine kinase